MLKNSLWRQFGATIDYLASTIRTYPDTLWHSALWDTRERAPQRSQAWYVAYHTLFWLDLYLTGAEEGFLPPPPFTLIEQEDDEPMPERPYTQAELLGYLSECRARCRATIEALTDETARRRCLFSWGEATFFELLIYNLRHVQEHTAQLNMLLGQHGIAAPDYITQLKRDDF